MKIEFKLDEQDILRIIERGLRDMIVGKVKVEGMQAKKWEDFDGAKVLATRCDYVISVDIERGGSDGENN